MSKYSGLGNYLKGQGLNTVAMTFSDIERVIGFKLPNSQKHQAWWSNSTSNNVMTQVWLDAGYRTEQVDTAARKLVFRKIASNGPSDPKSGGGMSDVAREFKSPDTAEKKPYRSPLWGALKGTFVLVPPGDNEPPPEDPESWESLALAKLDRLLFGKGE
jgi:hypothetical protein